MLKTGTCAFSAQQWADLKKDLSLPPRQADVLEQLLMGHSDKQIACCLQMSVSTVRSHLNHLFHRLGAEDRFELIVAVFTYFLQQHACGDHRHS